jgi:aldehyde dehydrogenase (NAD+)
MKKDCTAVSPPTKRKPKMESQCAATTVKANKNLNMPMNEPNCYKTNILQRYGLGFKMPILGVLPQWWGTLKHSLKKQPQPLPRLDKRQKADHKLKNMADIAVFCGNVGTNHALINPMKLHIDTITQGSIPQGLFPFCATIGQEWLNTGQGIVKYVISPTDHSDIGQITLANTNTYHAVVASAKLAFGQWQAIPAPKRGEIIRQIGNAFRENKETLANIITLEAGKIYQESLGEVQEVIDICDFAVGLSRQLYGLNIQSERPNHRMMEQWHPLGIVGVISAFNFPVAVWSWNAIIGAVCGNVTIWKPSEKTPYTAIFTQKIIEKVLKANQVPEGVFSMILGDASIGQAIAQDPNVALVSATGSTVMGKKVAQTVAARLGKSLLELSGNNAIILTEHAELELAIRSIVFGAVGTCGQRCTSTRRLIVHDALYETVKKRLVGIYQKLQPASPFEASTLVGPLIDQEAVTTFTERIKTATGEGGKLLVGGTVASGIKGNYVYPAIVEAENHYPSVQHETFGPILYLIKYSGEVSNAIALQNAVNQGLSSAIFSSNMRQAEEFLSAAGSDCGIANVNLGTSGAEIGGAFGGEKETGGGRESGSDAWKAYMRRQTCTINYGKDLPLAQGIKFDI